MAEKGLSDILWTCLILPHPKNITVSYFPFHIMDYIKISVWKNKFGLLINPKNLKLFGYCEPKSILIVGGAAGAKIATNIFKLTDFYIERLFF